MFTKEYNAVMCMPVYDPAVFDKAIACIVTAHEGSVKPDYTVVVDNSGGDFTLYYRGHTTRNRLPRVEIVTFQDGIGLTGAWNYAYHRFSTLTYALVLPGDDCVFHQHTLEGMLEVFAEDYTCLLTYPQHITQPADLTMSPWSFFVQHTALFSTIGLYDEDFAVYYADNDYAYRMKLAGLSVKDVVKPADVSAGHWGSATLTESRKDPAKSTEFVKRFEYVKALYKAKWGGEPEKETFLLPYNGADKTPILAELRRQFRITQDR